MTIEFSTARPEKNYSGASVALLVLSCAFFFIPTTLIVLGYYSSLPTGSLISPLPQGVISNSPSTNYDLPNHQTTETIIATPVEQPIASQSTDVQSNLVTKIATLAPEQTEVVVSDTDILPTSQVYLSNREGDKSTYSVKSKSAGQMVIMSTTSFDLERTVDYHLVNP